jgi:hypothetical protein
MPSFHRTPGTTTRLLTNSLLSAPLAAGGSVGPSRWSIALPCWTKSQSLSEMLVTDSPFGIDNVERRPVLIAKVLPDPVVARGRRLTAGRSGTYHRKESASNSSRADGGRSLCRPTEANPPRSLTAKANSRKRFYDKECKQSEATA